MSQFEQTRQQLNQARAARRDAGQRRDFARNRRQRIEARIAQLQRQANDHNAGANQQLEQLQSDLAEVSALLKRSETADAQAARELHERYTDFFAFTDPTNFVSQLDDTIPFLLFPVRVETRFKTQSAAGVATNELWVRIYPDGCLIDTFEPTLSGTEITAARRYYIESWKAGGIEAQERAAWRGLVSSVGAGRGAWIIQNFAPLNAGDKPTKNSPEAIILVVAADEPLPLASADVSDYWRGVWQARGDAGLLNSAFQKLLAAPGSSPVIAQQIVEHFAPDNIREWTTSAETDATVVFVQFTPFVDLDTKKFSWTQPPRVDLFPDRFVFIGQNTGETPLQHLFGPLELPLIVGPDPTEAQQYTESGGDLKFAEDIRWMVDFEAAVKKGLGLKVPLTAAQAAKGFERVFVVGIRLSADAKQNSADLESLLKNHLFSRSGFAFVPQGTPTNNTDQVTSPFNRTDDADDSYDVFVKKAVQFTVTPDPLKKGDGQWFAEWLGIDPAALEQVPNAGQTDQLGARAMNTALWQGTWGYYFERLLRPVLDDHAIRRTRSFFNQYVSGRGPVPALRIGRQPYGVLPVTAFRKLDWFKHADSVADFDVTYLARLYKLLLHLDDIWRDLGKDVPQVGRPNDPDPQATLLNILGLHPNAEEIHAVLGEPYELSHNTAALHVLDGQTPLPQSPGATGGQLLRELGYEGKAPDILMRIYFGRPFKLKDNLVDDRPPSETDPVRAYTPKPEELNYIGWLLKKGKESVDELRNEIGFTDNKKPNALLYLLLRHALILAFDRAARETKRSYVAPEVFQGWKKAQTFIHVATADGNQALQSESPWAHLYLDFPAVTASTNYPLGQYIVDHIETLSEADELREILDALKHLIATPTAALERLLREHLDLCHYRLDAWKMGFLHLMLSFMRFSGQRNPETPVTAKRGVHIGAYGWLENVKPQVKKLSPVSLDNELGAIFGAEAGPPLMRDSTNGGFIHAPSLNHAVTAAILRNGYRANATPKDPDLLSVNLSSERVRRAVGLIEGIRNGQKLGALLGYHFERQLHDAGTGLDKFILELRNKFSLNAQKLKTTQAPNTPIEFIEANNVVDGFALMDFLEKNKSASDPLQPVLPGSTAAERSAVLAAARRLFDLADGVADVAIAESVHQVVMGNYERAAATMDAYAAANLPPEPEVVRTPRSGHTLTHRAGIHLRSNATANLLDNPRVQAEPAVNDWLSDYLPVATELGLVVKHYQPENPSAVTPIFVTQADLGLAPLDLLFIMNEAANQSAAGFDDLVLAHVSTQPGVRPDTHVELAFTEARSGKITFFEVAPLLASMRALLLRSRPLQATDLQLPGEASAAKAGPIRLEKPRLDPVVTALNSLKTQTGNFITAVQPDADADLVTNLDTHLAQFRELSKKANLLGLSHTGFSMAWQNRASIYAAICEKVAALTTRWEAKLTASRHITNNLPAVPVEADIPQLQEAGRLVSTLLLPAGLLPPALRNEIVNRQASFEAKLLALKFILAAPPSTLTALHQQVLTQLPLTDFDPVEFTLAEQTAVMQTMLDDFLLRAQALFGESDRRLKAAAAILTPYAAADAIKQVKLLQEAGKALLGDDFQMVPAFKVSIAVGSEWKNGFDASDTLLTYVNTRPNNPLPLPVDEWLHGIARVREKLFHFENVVMLAGAFGQPEPSMRPVQLPFRANENWLALELDPANTANTLETERLLYTAHYSETFQPGAWQCGLLVDEWTEVIPQKEEVTGLTFHFDRPNAEPPQTWLLALPSALTGKWQWNDLLAALNETLDDARTRAVEPDALGPRFGALLPAVLTETSWAPITISANLIARAAFDPSAAVFVKPA
jgi:hypothetical protein